MSQIYVGVIFNWVYHEICIIVGDSFRQNMTDVNSDIDQERFIFNRIQLQNLCMDLELNLKIKLSLK